MKKILLSLVAIVCSWTSFAQIENSSADIIDYRDADGRIIVKAIVNGVEGDFLLDLAGHNAILSECMTKYKIDRSKVTPFNGYTTYQYKKVPVGLAYSAESVSCGNLAFGNEVKFFELQNEPYLRELGVDGVLNSVLFNNTVLTIDTKRKKITTTMPYRPQYMKLDQRGNLLPGRAQSVNFSILINGQPCNVILDTWNKSTVSLNRADFAKFSVAQNTTQGGVVSEGYGKDTPATAQMKGNLSFVKSTINDATIVENRSLPQSVVGLGLLGNSLISIDFSKAKVYFQPFDLVAIDDALLLPNKVVIEAGKLNPITRDYFLENIYDYKKSKNFVSKCDKPIVIDFWARWCGPCMKLLPQMEALAAKYKDQIIFLKVNADKEKELCNTFNIQALPTLFFIPAGGKPIVEIGASIEKYGQIIEEKLLKKSAKKLIN